MDSVASSVHTYQLDNVICHSYNKALFFYLANTLFRFFSRAAGDFERRKKRLAEAHWNIRFLFSLLWLHHRSLPNHLLTGGGSELNRMTLQWCYKLTVTHPVEKVCPPPLRITKGDWAFFCFSIRSAAVLSGVSPEFIFWSAWKHEPQQGALLFLSKDESVNSHQCFTYIS